jgi:hypothetical protein
MEELARKLGKRAENAIFHREKLPRSRTTCSGKECNGILVAPTLMQITTLPTDSCTHVPQLARIMAALGMDPPVLADALSCTQTSLVIIVVPYASKTVQNGPIGFTH